MNKLALHIATLFSCSLLFAEEATDTAQEKSPWEISSMVSAAYYPEVEHHRGSSHVTGISGPYDGIEAIAEFDAAYTLPFLRGDDEFTADNHVTFRAGLEVSPITIAPVASITVSPIAFLELAIGGTAGTGWNAFV